MANGTSTTIPRECCKISRWAGPEHRSLSWSTPLVHLAPLLRKQISAIRNPSALPASKTTDDRGPDKTALSGKMILQDAPAKTAKSGKIRQNPAKSGKIRQNPTKSGKIRQNPAKSGKSKKAKSARRKMQDLKSGIGLLELCHTSKARLKN